MRCKHLARFSRAPANCNHQGPELWLGPRVRRFSPGLTQARRLWLLARELCATAALYEVEGNGAAAGRNLRLAFTVLCDRAEIAEDERGQD